MLVLKPCFLHCSPDKEKKESFRCHVERTGQPCLLMLHISLQLSPIACQSSSCYSFETVAKLGYLPGLK